MKKRLFISLIVIASLTMSSIAVFAIDGVWHNPLGTENFYPTNELPVEPCERYPRDPIAGDNVYIKKKTWPIESGQTAWVTWSKNGVNSLLLVTQYTPTKMVLMKKPLVLFPL